jgi:hypothetical protein
MLGEKALAEMNAAQAGLRKSIEESKELLAQSERLISIGKQPEDHSSDGSDDLVLAHA